MKWLLSLLVTGGLLISLLAFITNKPTKSDFEAAKQVIMMRNVAHRVLQYSGDSTSAIPPVESISPSEYQITFAGRFSFKPDSLVKIIDHVLATGKLSSSYIVNVVETNTDKVVYGYAILGEKYDNIVPCLGRDQPAKQYRINIKFPDQKSGSNNLYIAGFALLGAGLGLFVFKRSRKALPLAEPIKTVESSALLPSSIGKYAFYPDRQLLVLGETEQLLTHKEQKILRIFAAEPNEIIDRNRIQKEVWEDEGVIVGRSLDMFISKLRKKLEDDPNVKLVNIHGRGYKLEIC